MKRKKGIWQISLIIVALVLLGVGAKMGIDWYTLSLYQPYALHDAIQGGDMEEVETLVSLGADLSEHDQNGQTPLHLLALTPTEHRAEIRELLLKHGADVHAVNDQGYTPLATAAYARDGETMRRLLEEGADPNAQNTRGESLLVELRRIGRYREEVELLLEAGAHIGLWEAVHLNDTERLIELLEQRPGDVNRPFANGRTLLMAAVQRGQLPMAKALLSLGADPNVQSDTLETVLYRLPYVDDTAMLKLLLEHGAQPNVQDGWGRTPLHANIFKASTETVKLLLDAGADPGVQDRYGLLPVHLIADTRWRHGPRDADERYKLLLDAGFPIDAQEDNGVTPLFRAARVAGPETIQRMLALGADPNHRSVTGESPMHGARADVVPVLHQAGAEVNITTDEGRTPLHYAVNDRNAARVDTLLVHGADPTLAYDGKLSALDYARDMLKRAGNNDSVLLEIVELIEAAVAERNAAALPK